MVFGFILSLIIRLTDNPSRRIINSSLVYIRPVDRLASESFGARSSRIHFFPTDKILPKSEHVELREKSLQKTAGHLLLSASCRVLMQLLLGICDLATGCSDLT